MGDLSSGERGSQMISSNAVQMLDNFGKVKTGADVQLAKLAEQAGVLISIDNMAYETATAIVNIKHDRELPELRSSRLTGFHGLLTSPICGLRQVLVAMLTLFRHVQICRQQNRI